MSGRDGCAGLDRLVSVDLEEQVDAFEKLLSGDMDALLEAFEWGRTRQGHEYWSNIFSGRAELDDQATESLIEIYEFLQREYEK
jgi:hypothetical protein